MSGQFPERTHWLNPEWVKPPLDRVPYKQKSQSVPSVDRLEPLLVLSHALTASSKRMSIGEMRGWTISCLVKALTISNSLRDFIGRLGFQGSVHFGSVSHSKAFEKNGILIFAIYFDACLKGVVCLFTKMKIMCVCAPTGH